MSSKILSAFPDHDSWTQFVRTNPFILSPEYAKSIAASAVEHGVRSAFMGQVDPSQVKIAGPDLRESLLVRGLNSRQRAVLELLAAEPWASDRLGARIYAAEALTLFALAMRGRFARFIGSEFVSGPAAKAALYPIEFQDLTNLSLHSNAFHCVITNDCLEHIPDIPACLREMHRVLQAGGVMPSTFPFTYGETGLVRARLKDGAIEHLAEPEYHGNPADPENGSLVFEVPGWDILKKSRAAGFSRAEMVYLSSFERGIAALDASGIMVLRCYK